MKKYILSAGITAVLGFLLFYIFLPAINPSNFSFWIYLAMLIGIFASVDMIVSTKGVKVQFSGVTKYLILGFGLSIIAIFVFNFFNSPFFRASAYANRIEINQENDFYEDVKEVNFKYIPLLDKSSSQKLGDRVMGQLPELVSQLEININKNLNLVYAEF